MCMFSRSLHESLLPGCDELIVLFRTGDYVTDSAVIEAVKAAQGIKYR